MYLIISGHKYHYESENLCRVFFPSEKIEVLTEDNGRDRRIVTEINFGEDKTDISVSAFFGDLILKEEKSFSSVDDSELCLATLLFEVLKKLTGYVPSWGLLTGVRPSKLMRMLTAEMGEEQAKREFTDKFFVSKEKTELAADVAKREERIIEKSRPESFSLYISIPFCPTRCSYCSFVSHSIEKAKKLLEPYVESLCEEIKNTGEIAKKLSLRLESIYFGGGTPTTLEPYQLSKICKTIEENFDLSTLIEYTVEAGRPDTVTKEKLLTLKEFGVERISINPQTFNDEVLEAIGRKHTSKQTVDAFNLARECGFNNINMDLIAGLKHDSLDSFNSTLDKVISLDAENVTVHTLALKRSSTLNITGDETLSAYETEKMVQSSFDKLTEGGYVPYYMYRQSKSLGNLENVGWCKNGSECAYNIFMMEECHTVLACGAGAVTKLKSPVGNHIERVFNFKYPYEYNDRFDEIIKRKDRIEEFYAEQGVK